ncbi:hypothetical protein, partial [Acinetobacter baumannii]|uniref:hypothetical protein n=1 Tax=Acinetobacter baumannii TaxID=470 RepID=UPI00335879B7
AVQHRLGPISLLDALTIIGGPAWRLDIEPVERTVCYVLRVPSPAPPFSTLELTPLRSFIFRPWWSVPCA